MTHVESYEVLIVGGGKAGKTLAADLARGGHRVALVERGMIGGTCINVGCIPSKALIRSASIAELTGRARDFGIRVDRHTTGMSGVLAYKRPCATESSRTRPWRKASTTCSRRRCGSPRDRCRGPGTVPNLFATR